jgi:hypothetical protein
MNNRFSGGRSLWLCGGIFALLLAASVMLGGCGDKKEAPKPDATKPAPKTVVKNTTSAPTPTAIQPAPAQDPFTLPVIAKPTDLPVNRKFDAVKLTVSGTKDMEAIIKQVKVNALKPAQLTGTMATAYKQATASLVLGDNILDITPPAEFADHKLMPGDLRLSLPLTDEQCKGATANNVGVVYLSDHGPVVIDGYYDQANKAVIVTVPHLTPFISFFRDPKQELTDYIASEASKRAWAEVENMRGKLEEKLISSVDEYLKKQAFEKLDGGVKRNILVGIAKHRGDLANLFSASGSGDATGFCQTYQVLVGKIIVDLAPASKLRDVLEAVTGNTETIATVSQAGGQAAGGDYWAAIEILGKAYSKTTPIYQYTMAAVSVIDAGWSMMKDDALEGYYRDYKKGDFLPERLERRMDLMMYIQRKFPKEDGKKMSDGEVVKFVMNNFERRKEHEKEKAQWEADLKQIFKWYQDRVFLKDKIKERFNVKTDADCFRVFLRILDSIDGHLVRMGICKKPWAPNGTFVPQAEMVELVQAFKNGGATQFNKTVKEIERRLAHPLDLKGYTGFWVLADTRKTPPLERRNRDNGKEDAKIYEAKQPAPTTYTGKLELRSKIAEADADGKPKYTPFTYKAGSLAKWDELPAIVPNGADWNLAITVTAKETCDLGWDDKLARTIMGEFGSSPQPEIEGGVLRFVDSYVSVLKSSKNHTRILSAKDKEGFVTQHVGAANDKPWTKPVIVNFPIMPSSYNMTKEQFVITIEANLPAGVAREVYTYNWVKKLPVADEKELQRQLSRANYKGCRAEFADMKTAAKASKAAPPADAKIVAGSKVVLKDLKFDPKPIIYQEPVTFEVTIENGPRVPSFSWYFSHTPDAKQADAWTTVPRVKYTYFKPGTYTVMVKVRDKNKYSAGDVAVASWQVTVVEKK